MYYTISREQQKPFVWLQNGKNVPKPFNISRARTHLLGKGEQKNDQEQRDGIHKKYYERVSLGELSREIKSGWRNNQY